jgi:hypothetical protein
MAPRFTVLLPAHNRADVIGFAVESALAQTEGDFELLVVGDGCTDGTGDVVHGFGDGRIRWLDLAKAPFNGYANRNVALRQARGDLIAYLPHDDLWLGDHLERAWGAFENTRMEWLYSLPVWVSPDGLLVPGLGDLRNGDELERFLTVGNFIPSACVVHRRSCLGRYGLWPEDVPSAGDWHYWRRILKGGGRRNFGFLPEPTALHFKAIWKSSVDQGMPVLGTTYGVASRADWWPRELKVPIPFGQTEQAVFWGHLERDGEAFQEGIRDGVARVILRLARDAVTELLPRSDGLVTWIGRSWAGTVATYTCPADYPGGPETFRTELEAVRLSPSFDAAWYLAANPDVARAGIEPASHYLVFGKAEGRRPHPER